MANSKFYIILNKRTITSGMKGSGNNSTLKTADKNGNPVATMRLITVLVFMFLLAANIRGQSPSFVYDNTSMTVNGANIQKEKLCFDYKQTPEWKRYKILRATGWTAVGVGGAMLIGGFIGDYIDNYGRGEKDAKLRYRIVWHMGAGVAAASVPLLTFAYINRHKAKKATAFSLSISNLSVDLPNRGTQSRPTLGISVNF